MSAGFGRSRLKTAVLTLMLAGLCSGSLLLSGCALTRPFRHHPPVSDGAGARVRGPSSGSARAPAPGDSLFVGPVMGSAGPAPVFPPKDQTSGDLHNAEMRPREPGTEKEGAPDGRTGEKDTETEKPAETPIIRHTAAGDSSAGTISVDLPPKEREQLLRIGRADWENARRLLAAVDTLGITEARMDQVRTARALLEAADQSQRRSDIREFAGLAHKAWILASAAAAR